jgi:hypothetical protein
MPRLAASFGALYVVLLFGGSASGIDALMPLELAALVLFVPFVAYLYSVLRRAEGEGGWLAPTVLGAGLLDTAIKLSSAAPALAARDLREGSQLDTLLHDINNASFVLTMYPLALLAGASAIVILSTGVLPRWLGWSGAATAAALAANGSFLEAEFVPAFLLFLAWTVATSLVLVRRAGAARPAAVRPGPEPILGA